MLSGHAQRRLHSGEGLAGIARRTDRGRAGHLHAVDRTRNTPAAGRGFDAGAAQGPRLGLSLRPLQPQEKQQSGLQGGLVVEQVGGAAERAGIEAGDVLLAINGKPVSSIEQIRGVLKSQPKSVALLVQRQGNQIFVPVPLG